MTFSPFWASLITRARWSAQGSRFSTGCSTCSAALRRALPHPPTTLFARMLHSAQISKGGAHLLWSGTVCPSSLTTAPSVSRWYLTPPARVVVRHVGNPIGFSFSGRLVPSHCRELLPVIVAVAVWGPAWSHSRVRCHCSNESVMHDNQSRTSQDPHMMHLLRCLFFLEAWHQIDLSCVHIPGVQNDVVDCSQIDLYGLRGESLVHQEG